MRSFRRAYYDWFSSFYDRFVAVHSSDRPGAARAFLAEHVPVSEGSTVLDICTGTGSLLCKLHEKVGPGGLVTGLDFSRGMLNAARAKTTAFTDFVLVEADAGSLPFAACSFDAVTCSHAFYELKGETQRRALGEIRRVLKPDGAFMMMEHDLPTKPALRALFYVRLLSMGAGRAISILKHEREVLGAHFDRVEKLVTPTGHSKVWVCRGVVDLTTSPPR
jgi:ubiquinone/menaquinone biosynthesis C-methylase UbiE